MPTFSKTILLACLALGGCLTYQPEQLQMAINQGDLKCEAQSWPTMSAGIHCFDEEESVAWLLYSPPKYLPFFEDLRIKRDQLAAQFDSGKLTKDQFGVQFAAYKQTVAAALQQQINADIAANQIAQQQADQLIYLLANALEAYGQIRTAQLSR